MIKVFSIASVIAALSLMPAYASFENNNNIINPAEGVPTAVQPSQKNERFEDSSEHSSSSYISHIKGSDKAKKRVLSLAGGGYRGVYEAALLVVMEELLNIGNPGPWKRIAEKFDVIGGTSTGSLLAAGLAFKSPIPGVKPYTAMDLLKLYVRHGYRIFDDHKRVTQGINGALYGNEGLDELLSIYFEDHSDFKNVATPLYVFAHNDDKSCVLIHSTHSQPSLNHPGHAYPLKSALGESTAAPIYFPARKMKHNGKEVNVSDGGTVANQPAKIIFDKTVIEDQKAIPSFEYEIYALGTGDVVTKPSIDQASDRGIGRLYETFCKSLEAQVKAAIQACEDEVEKDHSPATFFAHLNPRVNKDSMDDTSSGYTHYMLQKVLDFLRDSVAAPNSAFKAVLKQLDISVPDLQVLESVTNKIRTQLYAISEDTYLSVMGQPFSLSANEKKIRLEKEWLIKLCQDAAANGLKPYHVDLFNNAHPEGQEEFTPASRAEFLLKLLGKGKDSVEATFLKKVDVFQTTLQKIAAYERSSVVWNFTEKNWPNEGPVVSYQLMAEFNKLCQEDPSLSVCALKYLSYGMKHAELALEKADTKTRAVIFAQLNEFADFIKKESKAYADSHGQTQSWGDYVYSKLRGVVNPYTAAAATLGLITTLPAVTLGAVGYAAYNYKDLSTAVVQRWTGDMPAPEGTVSRVLYDGYLLYLDGLKQRFGMVDV